MASPAYLPYGARLGHAVRHCVYGCILSALLAPLAAGEAAPESTAESLTATAGTWGIGIGAGAGIRPYQQQRLKWAAFPLITYKNSWFSFDGFGAELSTGSNHGFSLQIQATYIHDGYKADDAPILTDMSTRPASIWAGGGVSWRHGGLRLSAKALTDTLSHSDGMRVRNQIQYMLPWQRMIFIPQIGIEWLDDHYTDYYFGVAADEARSWRPRYTPHATWTGQIGLHSIFLLTPRQHIFASIGATRFSHAITASPLVSRQWQGYAFIGYQYTFAQ